MEDENWKSSFPFHPITSQEELHDALLITPDAYIGPAVHTALELAFFIYECTGDIFPYCSYKAATFSYVIFRSMNVS